MKNAMFRKYWRLMMEQAKASIQLVLDKIAWAFALRLKMLYQWGMQLTSVAAATTYQFQTSEDKNVNPHCSGYGSISFQYFIILGINFIRNCCVSSHCIFHHQFDSCEFPTGEVFCWSKANWSTRGWKWNCYW